MTEIGAAARPSPARTAPRTLVLLLVAIILLDLAYPFSELGTWQAIAYNVLFSAVYGLGIYSIASRRYHAAPGIGAGILNLILGTAVQLVPVSSPAFYPVLAGWAVLVTTFNIAIIGVLMVYIFEAEVVTTDVLVAAVCIYLLLGILFTPIYNFIHIILPGAFAISSGDPVTWQRLLYFSYATLTTAGYGDITAVRPQAQAVAMLQAALGVMYVTILMGRLVGLYAGARRR